MMADKEGDWTKDIFSGMIECDGHAHGVSLWVDADERDVVDRIGGVNFWYQAGYDGNRTLGARIKEAWRVLWGHRITIEDIIVREVGARLLAQRFTELADAIKRGPEKKEKADD